jgi:colanic acid/amylovoran biosynthesis glycosyltransferase
MTSLVIISPLKGLLRPGGNIVLTEKFIVGLKLYRELWGGPVSHLCEPTDRESHNLDNQETALKTPEFNTVCHTFSERFFREAIPKDSLAVASAGEKFNSVSRICKEIGVPCVYVTEYSLRTRHQIIDEYRRSRLHGAWQKLRQVQQELAQRKAISLAAGVQCNGLPTFNAYKGLNSSPHLFFDNRTESSMLATEDQVKKRCFEYHQGHKLRLTFSGRLTLMKGVDDLLLVASHLREMGEDWFEMSICGDGDYVDHLRRGIELMGLNQVVRLRGSLDFKTELIPFLKNDTDLFVCCHRQGDPSCTYLETMACGVPIIGYANEAWEQLSDYSRAGWVTRIGDPQTMASQIIKISKKPDELEGEALRSLSFAKEHYFEKTFRRRVEHFQEIAS